MDLSVFFTELQNSWLGVWINTGGATYPTIEVFHVISLCLVFGTIFIVDLRLLGVASMSRPFTRVAHDLLRVTWLAFLIAAFTGSLLFVANAGTIWSNLAFQIKMVLLVLAAVNMAVFELITARTAGVWDLASPPPNAARVAGLLSICLWIGVIVCGRLIGFTTEVTEVTEDPFAALL